MKDSGPAQPAEPRISLNEEYRLLHDVARTLQTAQDTPAMLQQVMRTLTGFEELNVESKAGVFLADPERRVLTLFTTFGEFTGEFLHKEREVPFGDCLCGRAAASGELLMSDSCFTDGRHERKYGGMTPHGHYIIPLKSRERVVGVMFLYTQTHPSWYRFSREVLMSIGGLIGDAIVRQRNEDALMQYQDNLETLVEQRTQELIRIRERLRRLNQRLQSVQEEEKTRIAREVHDQLGQALTALSLDVAWLEKHAETRALSPRLREMQALIQETIDRTQKIASELRPNVLDVMGLCEALRWQARQFTERSGIACHLDLNDACAQLDPGRATTIFRIFQEALTNVSRHAGAGDVWASFKNENGAYELVVRDNGRGMDPHQAEHAESLGLMGIRERALLWNGTAAFESAPGEGTRVRVRIPCDQHGG